MKRLTIGMLAVLAVCAPQASAGGLEKLAQQERHAVTCSEARRAAMRDAHHEHLPIRVLWCLAGRRTAHCGVAYTDVESIFDVAFEEWVAWRGPRGHIHTAVHIP